MMEKRAKPEIDVTIMLIPAREVVLRRSGTRMVHLVNGCGCPSAHCCVGDFGVKLNAIGRVANTKGLVGEGVS